MTFNITRSLNGKIISDDEWQNTTVTKMMVYIILGAAIQKMKEDYTKKSK